MHDNVTRIPPALVSMSHEVIAKIHEMHTALSRLEERGIAVQSFVDMIERRLDRIESRFALVYTGVFLALVGAVLAAVMG